MFKKKLISKFHLSGYPFVTVDYNDEIIFFTQRREFSLPLEEPYSIPLTFSTKSKVDFERKTVMEWLNFAAQSYDHFFINDFKPGEWIILNHQQVGYYRVDYSTKIWQAIIEQLKEDFTVIHPIN